MKKKITLVFLLFFFLKNDISAQNRALSLSTNDYVQTSFSSISGNSSRTVEAWIKTTANCIPNAGGVQQVIVDWGTFVNTQRFTMNLLWSNALRIEVGGNGLSGSIAVNDGVWHHVAVVYNSSLATNQYSLYVDGVLDATGNLSVATNTGTSVPMRIGQRVDGVNNFNGEIDEVRIFDFPRTVAQINADKDKELCTIPTGLVAYYKLNEGTPNAVNAANTSAVDYSGNGNNGTLTNFSLVGTSSNWVNGPNLNPASSFNTYAVNSCSAITSPSGNYTWSVSGTYMDTVPNASACDSILTVNLTIGDATSSINASACNSYTSPSGSIYTNSAMFNDTLVNGSVGGCDSIITINLTIGSSFSNIDTMVCNSYTSPSGSVYTSSAVFNDTLFGQSYLGCDSIISINLSVFYPATTSEDLVVCEDSVLVGTSWYFANQTVVLNDFTSVGCDSTHSVHLIFAQPSYDAVAVSSCGTYTSPLGNVYGSSAIFSENYYTSLGCDSIIEYTLTVHNSSSTNNSVTGCDSVLVNGVFYTSSQSVTYVLTDQNGCDSTIITDITIVEIDNALNVNGFVISAASITGATYNWINCTTNEEVVSGSTNSDFTATEDGDYKVEITVGNCTKESQCVTITGIGINNTFLSQNLKIIPNPNTGNFIIELGNNDLIESYEIINVIGKVVSQKRIMTKNVVSVNESLPKGVYFIKLASENNAYLKQFIVK